MRLQKRPLQVVVSQTPQLMHNHCLLSGQVIKSLLVTRRSTTTDRQGGADSTLTYLN